jgi:SAM-dependent methyltransferase
MKVSTRRPGRRIKTIVHEIRKNGFVEAVRYACHRVAEHYGDWRMNIQTSRYVPRSELGYADTSPNVEYEATSYDALHSSFDRVPIRPGRSVCVDFGCGMGRAAIFAAGRGFRKVVGVEYSAELAEVALQNVRRAAKRLRCPVEIVNADAQWYPVPDDADVIFMFNPFRDIVLANVIKNIHESIRRHPREIWIIFVTPGLFEPLIHAENWIIKICEHVAFPRTRYAIYRCHGTIGERRAGVD